VEISTCVKILQQNNKYWVFFFHRFTTVAQIDYGASVVGASVLSHLVGNPG
jgi:hypothetical protein